MYSYYTVLGCEWELTGQSVWNTDAGIQIAHDYYAPDTFPTATYSQMKQWKNLEWDYIPSGKDATNGQSTRSIKGHYKRGQAKRDVKTDSLTETWTLTGSTPQLLEMIYFNFFPDPIGSWEDDIALRTLPSANFCMTLKYLVQFKDLKQTLRQPNGATGNMPTESDMLPAYAQ